MFYSMSAGATLIGLLIHMSVRAVSSTPCHEDMSIEIGSGDYKIDSNSSSLLDTRNGIEYEPSLYWQTETEGVYRACICQLKTCIRKCCGQGEVIVGHSCVPSNSSLVNPFAVELYDDVIGETGTSVDVANHSGFFLLTGFPRCAAEHGKFVVDPDACETDRYLVLSSGVLYLLDVPVHEHEITNYCLEAIFNETDDEDSRVLPVLCFPPEADEPMLVYIIFQVVSLPFLLATFLVYACIPELRNYHGKSLMCYVISLLTAFAALSISQCNYLLVPSTACLVVASIIQFSFLAAFFWLNAMCFDIWWTFSGCKAFRGAIRTEKEERTKFVLCSLYAWGCPIAICAATAFVNLSEDVFPDWLIPWIGLSRCWFENRHAEMMYFYGPIGILLSLNVLMFVMTSLKICSSAKDTAVLRHRDSNRHNENDRQRFYLYLKLFVLMGANWIMEVISWFAEPSRENWYIWFISDMCDTLTGVIIFFLFVCTHKNLRLIKKKICSHLELSKDSSTKNTSSSKIMTSSSARERGDSETNGSKLSLKRMNSDSKKNGSLHGRMRTNSEPKMNGSLHGRARINSEPKMNGSVHGRVYIISEPKMNGSVHGRVYVNSEPKMNGSLQIRRINSDSKTNGFLQSFKPFNGDVKMKSVRQIYSDPQMNGSLQSVRQDNGDVKINECAQKSLQENGCQKTNGSLQISTQVINDPKIEGSLQNIRHITTGSGSPLMLNSSDLSPNESPQNITNAMIHSNAKINGSFSNPEKIIHPKVNESSQSSTQTNSDQKRNDSLAADISSPKMNGSSQCIVNMQICYDLKMNGSFSNS